MTGSRAFRVLGVVAGLLLTSAAVIALWIPAPSSKPTTSRHVRVAARDFAFAPAVIEVDPGDRVILELESGDVVHGLHLDGYDVDLTADPGQPATATFIADRSGSYRFRCNIPCGPLHPFMAGTLRVGPPRAFWAALLMAAAAVVVGGTTFIRKPGAPPARAAVP